MENIKKAYSSVYNYIFSKKCILRLPCNKTIEYKNLSPDMHLGSLMEEIIQSPEMIGEINNDMAIYHGTTNLHYYNMTSPLKIIFDDTTIKLHVTYLNSGEFMKSLELYRHYNLSSV